MVVRGERLRQARKIHRFTQTKMAGLLGLTQAAVSRYESGEMQPTPDVVEQVAAVTGFPARFFHRAPGPEIPEGSLAFRARRYASTKLDLDQAQAWTELVYEVCAGLASRVETPSVRLPRLDGEEPRNAARIVRAALGLSPDRPIPNVTYALERAGVFVLALPVPLIGRDAFSTWTVEPRRIPIVVVPENGSGGVRFWLAHELAHLIDPLVHGYVKQTEDAADAFAAEFLMPRDGIRDELVSPISLELLAHLARRWGVSRQSVIMRAVELEVISARRGQQLFQVLAKHANANQSEPKEKPRMLRKMAEVVYGMPPAPRKLASDYDIPLDLAAAMLNAHASRNEVVAVVPADDSRTNVVKFRPRTDHPSPIPSA